MLAALRRCRCVRPLSLALAVAVLSPAALFAQPAAKTAPAADPAAKAPDEKAGEEQATPRQKVIRISKKTTRLTEPLTDDGFVDYVAAFNRRKGKGVTPENNFEVVVRRVMGHGELSEEVRPLYYEKLGISVPKEDSFSYRSLYRYVEFAKLSKEDREAFEKEYDRVSSAPWKPGDHPRVQKWLVSVDEALDTIVEGSKRSHHYTPYVTPPPKKGEEEPLAPLVGLLLPAVQSQREMARALHMRSLQRIGTGDLDGAWSDLQAIHRIARHSDRNGMLIEGLVGIAIDSIAYSGQRHVLNAEPTKKQLARFTADLKALTPLEPMARKIDETERYMGLDAVQSFARNGLDSAKEMENLVGFDGGPWGKVIGMLISGAARQGEAPLAIDWNITMELLNGYYDTLTDAMREPDLKKRDAKFAALDERFEKLRIDAQNPAKMLLKVLGGDPRKTTAEAIGNVLAALLLPAVQQVRMAEDRTRARADVTRIGFALRQYEAETGAFPKSLDALVPGYLPKIPMDPVTEKPLIYRADEKGFVVYGLGRNRKDDRGAGYDDRSRDDLDSDDIAVRYTRK